VHCPETEPSLLLEGVQRLAPEGAHDGVADAGDEERFCVGDMSECVLHDGGHVIVRQVDLQILVPRGR